MIKKEIILLFLFLSNLCYGQGPLSFSIRMVGLPSGSSNEYIFDSKRLLVLENSGRITLIKFKEEQLKGLDSMVNLIMLDTLQSEYSRSSFDGTHWTFNFNQNYKQKEIRLHNYYLDRLDNFLRYVNSFIPVNKQRLSFGDNMHLIPDTLIRYLPDFYLDTLEIPDSNYGVYSIMCFKKGYFYSEDLELIALCDCRIYPKIYGGKYINRAYWRAFRLDSANWNREYYDNSNNIIKTDTIHDILPYIVVNEKIIRDRGNRPSVIIYRYYKTVIEN